MSSVALFAIGAGIVCGCLAAGFADVPVPRRRACCGRPETCLCEFDRTFRRDLREAVRGMPLRG